MLHQQLHNSIPKVTPLGRRVTALFDRLGEMVGREPPPQTPLLLHYHIFKNAGSSFEWALEQGFGEGYRSFDFPSPRAFVSNHDLAIFADQNPAVSAISSHQAAPPAPKIRGRNVITSILIRDPIARVRSIYSFERRQQLATPGAIKAKELDFKQYVEWRLETSLAMLCNFQVHFCTRTAGNRTEPPNRERLDEAIRNLDGISIVGTVGRYDDWITLAQAILGASFPDLKLPSVQHNVTAGVGGSEAVILGQLKADLGDATAQYLVENNQLDMCLHQVADAILTRRLAETGAKLSLLQAYGSAWQSPAASTQLSKVG